MAPPPFLFASTVSLLNLAFIENGYLKRPNVDNITVLHTAYRVIQFLEPSVGTEEHSLCSQPCNKLSDLIEGIETGSFK